MTTPIRRRLCQLRDDESGQTLVYIAIGFMTFVAASTFAVDVGTVVTARTQAQSAANAAALAGATALVHDASSPGVAVQGAIATARKVSVVGTAPSVLPTDVTFEHDAVARSSRVQVKVYRTAARQTALPTLFGPLIGVPTIDVAASATAEALPANAVACVKPFMIADKWIENSDSQGRTTGAWTPASQFDVLAASGTPLASPDVYYPVDDVRYTGYTVSHDKGLGLTLHSATGAQVTSTGYVPWKMSPDRADYRDDVAGCTASLMHLGQAVAVEPGHVPWLAAGVQDLIDQDPQARWDPRCKCVADSAYGTDSPRVFPIPLYDPAAYAAGSRHGRTEYRVANFLGFFVDALQGDSVSGYITDIIGVIDATAGPAPAAAFPKTIRLVQ